MEQILKVRHWLEEHRDIFVDVLRIYLGIALFLKGLYFLSHASVLHETLGSQGINYGNALYSHLIPAIHLLGGTLMIVGLGTRFAALLQVPLVLGALLFVHLREGLFTTHPNLELTALVVVCLLVIAAHGSGRLSADYYLLKHPDDTRENEELAHYA
jgi:putative oxidoreductase